MYPTLLWLSLALYVVTVLIYLRQNFASVYHPISFYLAFHGLVFAIRPLFAHFYNYDLLYRVYRFNPTPEVKSTVIIAANLGLLAFLFGAWKSGGAPLAFHQTAAHTTHRKRLIPAFLLTVLLVAPIAIASIRYVLGNGYAGMRLDANAGVFINTTSNGWLLEAQLMLVPMSVLVAWIFRFRFWSILPLIVFVVARAGTGGRGPFIVACAAAGMLWLFDNKHRWPTLRMIGMIIPVIIGFYVVGQERGLVNTFLKDGEVIEIRDKSGFLESMDFANLEFFEYLAETVPRKTGTYGYFVDNLQVFTEPVPRVLWKAKPLGAPIKMFNIFDYGNPIGITYSLPGYGWIQLGYLGVALWCGLWGWVLGSIYSRFVQGGQSNFQVALYFAFLPIFIIAFRDGGLVTVARTGVFYLTPVLLWIGAARALGIPDPVDLAKRAVRGRRVAQTGAVTSERVDAVAAPNTTARAQFAGDEIVPRAWRNPGGTPRTR